MRSGFVSVVGRPNVGKSTLVNQMVGSKVSITSKRPQTTRNTIRGVVHGNGYQLVLVDTPGLHKPRTELGTRLNSLVYGSLADTDAVMFVIDATMPIGPGDRLIAQRLVDSKASVFVVVNKVDIASRSEVVTQLSEAAEWDFEHYYPVSASSGEGVDALLEGVAEMLPEGPAYYPESMTTDLPERVVIAEIVREKFLDRLRQELPHAIVVHVEDMETDGGVTTIHADVIVERDSQKGIVIGRGGEMLRLVGTEARLELESLLGGKVNLQLRVRVEPDWQRRPQLLDRLGFGDD